MAKDKDSRSSGGIVAADELWLPAGASEKMCLACNRTFSPLDNATKCSFDGTALISLRKDHKDHNFQYEYDDLYFLERSRGRNYLYRGRDRSDDAYVVIKVAGCTPDRYHRFHQEYEILKQLDHPNIVRFRSSGKTESGVPFYITDFVPGIPLNRLMDAGSIDLDSFIRIFGAVAAAMQHAHDRNLVHWDFKPNDIMIGEDCKPVIFDFGKGTPWLHGDNRLQQATANNDTFGDPLYIAPEVCFGKDVDVAANIYSLGCMMYAAIEGVPPFEGNTWADIAMKKQAEAVPQFSKTTKSTIPSAIAELIAKMLSKEPDKRPASMLAIKEVLDR